MLNRILWVWNWCIQFSLLDGLRPLMKNGFDSTPCFVQSSSCCSPSETISYSFRKRQQRQQQRLKISNFNLPASKKVSDELGETNMSLTVSSRWLVSLSGVRYPALSGERNKLSVDVCSCGSTRSMLPSDGGRTGFSVVVLLFGQAISRVATAIGKGFE